MIGLRLMLRCVPPRDNNREGYVRPELRDLAVLADLLESPLLQPEMIEREVYRLMGLEVPEKLELPATMRQDIRRARRFQHEAA